MEEGGEKGGEGGEGKGRENKKIKCLLRQNCKSPETVLVTSKVAPLFIFQMSKIYRHGVLEFGHESIGFFVSPSFLFCFLASTPVRPS